MLRNHISAVAERRSFLKTMLAMSGALALTPTKGLAGVAHAMLNPMNGGGLKDYASAKRLIYGAASNRRALSDENFARAFVRDCGLLVPESALKWKNVHPQPGRFDFSEGDWLLHFCADHNLLYRGHTLAWYNANPDWLLTSVNRNNARDLLQKHIETVVGHYVGKMHSWDVVNEVVQPPDGRDDGLRQTIWLENIGPDYIDLAFRTAAQADSKALLMYNENHVEYDNLKDNNKRAAVLKLLRRLKSADVPIQGFGIQAHLRANDPNFNAGKMRDFVRQVGAMDLKIMITELDVSDESLPSDSGRRDDAVSKMYGKFLNAVLAEKSVIGVTTWGLADRYTWLKHSRGRGGGSDARPLLLDQDLQPKSAWNAVAQAFDQAPAR